MSSGITQTNPPLELDPCVEPIVAISQAAADWLGVPRVRCFIYNQKWLIPDGPQMFMVFSVLSDMPFASGLSYDTDPATGDLVETVGANVRSVMQWEIWSRNADARLNRVRAINFLHSTACQQMCEKYGFAVASAPTSFSDLSYGDGAARMNKYQITFTVLAGEANARVVDSFNNFTGSPAFVFNP